MDRTDSFLYKSDMTSDSLIDFNSDPRFYHCESGWSWSPPPLTDYDFWLVLSGRGFLERNRERHELKGGSSLVLRPGDRIAAHHDPSHPLRVFSFHFRATRPPLPPAERLPVYRRIHDLDLLDALVREAEWPLPPRPDRVRRAALAAAMLLAVQADPAAESAGTDDRLHACARGIRNAPGREVSIADLAQECGMSEGHFCRRFHQTFGLSPSSFRLRARIDRARHLLRESPLPLSAIAEATGFHDDMHFSRVFKQQTGLPPGRYRKAVHL